MKKRISIILCLSIIIAIPLIAAAVRHNSKDGDIITASPEQMEAYRKYEVNADMLRDVYYVSGAGSEKSDKEIMLSTCRLSESYRSGDTPIEIYTSENLSEYIPLCGEMVEISTINGYLYITYYTADRDFVILCYDDNGLYNKCVYHESADTAYYETENEAQFLTDFRSGQKHDMLLYDRMQKNM